MKLNNDRYENDNVFYDEFDELSEMRLFPDFLPESTASATESTGLIRVGMTTPGVQKRYDSVYSYRQKKAYKKDGM